MYICICIFLYMYFRFGGCHIRFAVKEQLWVMLHSTVESGTPENMGIAFGISFLANPYADIKVFSVLRSPSSMCRASAKTWV